MFLEWMSSFWGFYFFKKETTEKSKESYVRTDRICLRENQNKEPGHVKCFFWCMKSHDIIWHHNIVHHAMSCHEACSLVVCLRLNCPGMLWEHTSSLKCKSSDFFIAYFCGVNTPPRWVLGFSGGTVVKSLPAIQETQVQSLGQVDPLGKEMSTRSSIFAWEILWTEEPGGL